MATTTEHVDGAVLFNCCTNWAAPDWSLFASLETGGCIANEMANGTTHVDGGISDDRAEFWTVYARHHSGEAEAITDCASREAVDQVAQLLRALSGLPCF